MRVVNLPSRFDMNAIDEFTRQFVLEVGHPIDQLITIDFDDLSFIDGRN